MMKILLAIQARSNSTRLPNKIFETIGDKSVLQWVYESAKDAERKLRVQKIECKTLILGPHDDRKLLNFTEKNKMDCVCPDIPENDLISRFLWTLKTNEFSHILRLTADCWMLHSELIMEAVRLGKETDYFSNTVTRSFQEGLDFQMASANAWKWIDEHQKENREHPFIDFDRNYSIRKQFEDEGFLFEELLNPHNEQFVHTSIDTKEDLDRARIIYQKTNELERTSQERPSAGA